MAIREIRKKGDPCLEKVCHPVTEFNERLHLLLDDMRETLEESGGVGLAAPQVGLLRRGCIVAARAGALLERVPPEIVQADPAQISLNRDQHGIYAGSPIFFYEEFFILQDDLLAQLSFS